MMEKYTPKRKDKKGSSKYKIIEVDESFDISRLTGDIRDIIRDSWGEFSLDYIKNNILTSQYIFVVLWGSDIVAFNTAKEYVFNEKKIYYLEFAAVKPEHQGNNLSVILTRSIIKKIFLKNFLKLNLCFEFVTISPNPRVLGSLLRNSRYTFPDMTQEETPKEIWDKIQFIVNKIDEPYTSLDRRGPIIEGFYNDVPHLIYDPQNVPLDRDKSVNDFAKKMLQYEKKKGREFVIYSKFCLLDILKSLLKGLKK